ncbi:MAG: ComF family protein [Saprospiraceae bacterium]|jgi:ComF family protein
MFRQLFTFIYPRLCSSCERELRDDEKHVCLHCSQDIPPFVPEQDHNDGHSLNPMFQLFWGKSDVQYATSCYQYIKGEKLQKLVHELKYNGRKNLASYFGEMMAQEIKNNSKLCDIDAICFVPSSKQKIRVRGYNQAQELAISISKYIDKPSLDLLMKKKNTASQTTKNVHDRHLNLEKSFSINKKLPFPPQCDHVLLIDDVITTGATLNACAKLILSEFDVKVSVLTLAYRHV